MFEKLAGALARHALTAAAGALVAKGIVDPGTVEAVKTGIESAGVNVVEVASGVVLGGIGYAWSAFNKWRGR